jgi:hypothetical protein
MANKYMKQCSITFATKEMQIKMTLKFHLSPVKMAIINNTNNKKYGEVAGDKGTLLSVEFSLPLLVVMKISTTTMEKSMEVHPKTKNRTTV